MKIRHGKWSMRVLVLCAAGRWTPFAQLLRSRVQVGHHEVHALLPHAAAAARLPGEDYHCEVSGRSTGWILLRTNLTMNAGNRKDRVLNMFNVKSKDEANIESEEWGRSGRNSTEYRAIASSRCACKSAKSVNNTSDQIESRLIIVRYEMEELERGQTRRVHRSNEEFLEKDKTPLSRSSSPTPPVSSLRFDHWVDLNLYRQRITCG